MATTSQCSTETLFHVLQLGLMNKKAHTWQVLWCLGSEGTRWWQAEISFSPNYFIHRKTALLSVEQMRRVIWDERTWCFPDCRRKNSFYKVTCVEAESRNAARALWTASWELTTGAKQYIFNCVYYFLLLIYRSHRVTNSRLMISVHSMHQWRGIRGI